MTQHWWPSSLQICKICFWFGLFYLFFFLTRKHRTWTKNRNHSLIVAKKKIRRYQLICGVFAVLWFGCGFFGLCFCLGFFGMSLFCFFLNNLVIWHPIGKYSITLHYGSRWRLKRWWFLFRSLHWEWSWWGERHWEREKIPTLLITSVGIIFPNVGKNATCQNKKWYFLVNALWEVVLTKKLLIHDPLPIFSFINSSQFNANLLCQLFIGLWQGLGFA